VVNGVIVACNNTILAKKNSDAVGFAEKIVVGKFLIAFCEKTRLRYFKKNSWTRHRLIIKGDGKLEEEAWAGSGARSTSNQLQRNPAAGRREGWAGRKTGA